MIKRVIGISAYYHDSAAALVEDGIIKYASHEERFTRKKHDESFPKNAIKQLLIDNDLLVSDITAVAFYDKPLIKFERLLSTFVSQAPKGLQRFKKAMPIWLKEKLFLRRLIRKELIEIDKDFKNVDILFSEHHISHAASAFYPSPFNEALIITMDGVGEWVTTSIAIGNENDIEIKKEIEFPNSVGLIYSAFTYYCGFKVNSGEYKLMGLAPYGSPKFSDIIKTSLIDIKDDGSFRLDQSYFDYVSGNKMTNKRFSDLFGHPPRKNEDEPLTQFHMDIAASIQAVTEEIVCKICMSASNEFQIKNLCLAGGVALNCVANGKLRELGIFDEIWVQPAAGDAGGALGTALAASHMELELPRKIEKFDAMSGSYLGSKFSQKRVEDELKGVGANFKIFSRREISSQIASLISDGKSIGWFQGRSEFGPRALGNRSIIADPRNSNMQKELNLKIKFRESFRPFAPSVLEEDAKEWFESGASSPYMLFVSQIRKDKRIASKTKTKKFGLDLLNEIRSQIPAVTHVDNSARVQTVSKKTNPEFHSLISEFKKLTGCGVLINTSFNVRGEPIVNSPIDAFKCFMGTNLDILVIENCVLFKEEQDRNLAVNYSDLFEAD